MRYVEKELYEGIETRLLAGAIESHYIDNGHVKPVTIRQYNDDYDSDGGGQQPFNRPAVFVQFGEYELQDMGGYVKGPVPITLHVVQDNYNQSGNISPAQETKYQDKLKYPSLIQELLHGYQISNCILDVKQPQKLLEQKSLLVFTIQIIARVRLSRRSSSLPAEIPMSAFNYDSPSQTIDSGNPIAAITASTTGDVARFVVDINSTILSGLVLDAATGQITGTPTAEGSFKVAAISQYGQVIGVVTVSVMFTGSATPITSMDISNDGQTIWEASGVGEYQTIAFTPDPSDATFSLDDTNLPAGFSISGNQIIEDDFSLIPAGVNTFDVDWSGTGDYSGSGTISVTITKRELLELSDIGTFTNIKLWADLSEDGDVTVSGDIFTAVNGQDDNNENFSFASGNAPLVGDINGVRCGIFNSRNIENVLSSDISLPAHIFLIMEGRASGRNSIYSFLSRNDFARFEFTSGAQSIPIKHGGQTITLNLTDSESKEITNGPVLVHLFLNGASSYIEFNAGSISKTLNFSNSDDLPTNTEGISFFTRGVGSTAEPSGTKGGEFVIYQGALSSSDLDDFEGVLMHRWKNTANIPSGHTHENLPPFKSL